MSYSPNIMWRLKQRSWILCLEATLGDGETWPGLVQVQSQVTNITMQLQHMAKAKVVWEHVWCTMCHIEGHHRNECPTLGSYMTMDTPNRFPTRLQIEWCEICRQWGNIPPRCPTLKRYQKTTHAPFCEFCKSMGHDVNNYWSIQLMQGQIAYAFQV
jgi:hypothetical protein